MGCGVGRNSIYVAERFKNINCIVDCVDLLEIAIEKLDQNAKEHNVSSNINGINKAIEDYEIEKHSYDFIMAISALEHIDTKEVIDAQFEVNLPTEKIQEYLNKVFDGWSILKTSIKEQEYDIPREQFVSHLHTNVVTFVARKG